MMLLDGDFIRAVAPHLTGPAAAAQARIIAAISGAFAPTLAAHAIETPLRIAHFMGQVTHESAGFRTTVEFASGAAYEGRADLGNTRPGDGPRFKGRGLIQLTGRANYRRIGGLLGLPLEDEPELAAEPLISLRIACAYWTMRAINDPADADDLETVTRRVNGGLNGLEDRRRYLRRAKAALAAIEAGRVAPGHGGAAPVLRRGSTGEAVGEAQRLLRAKGFPIAVDNAFGPATERAVIAVQRRAGLAGDGVIGPRTWAALRA